MPALTAQSQMLRISQCISVMFTLYEKPELSEREACEIVGISPDVYREWLRREPEAINSLRNFIAETQRDLLFQLSIARNTGVGHLINAVVDKETGVKARISALAYLDKVREELEKSHHAQPGVEEEAHGFLKTGPQLTSGKSRLASLEVSRTEDGITVNIFKEDPVIDQELRLAEEDNQDQ